MSIEDRVPLNFRLPRSLKERVDAAAASHGLSTSAYITLLLDEHAKPKRGRPFTSKPRRSRGGDGLPPSAT